MPTELDQVSLQHVIKHWLAYCALQTMSPPTTAVKVNGQPVSTLINSRSTVTLACPTTLSPLPEPKGVLPVSCIHGDILQVPAAEVMIFFQASSWPLLISLIPELLVHQLLWWDWPGFPKPPAMASHHRR